VREANEMGGRDNITVICFRIGGTAARGAHDGEADEPDTSDTMVGVRAPAAPEAAAPEAAAAAAEAEPALPEEPPPGTPARRRRRLKVLAAAVLAAAVLAGAVIGGLAVARNFYFLGQDGGLVALYRGVPYELPLGIDLYEKRYVSSVPVGRLTPVERRRLLDHKLRSREDAVDLMRRLERSRTP
jgi:protein phosphatase